MSFRRSVLVFAATLAAVVAVGAAETDWTMSGYDIGHTGYTPQQLQLPLTLSWQFNTPKFSDNRSTPAVADGVIYFATGNRVFAVDTATGSQKWKYPSTAPLNCNVKTGITISEGLIYFGGTDGNLYALSAKDGHMVWTYPTNASVRSTPIVSNGYVYVGSDDNLLYCIDAKSGESIWIDKKHQPAGFRTGDDVQSPPAIAPGLVVFISMDTNVYAANSSTGALRWSYRLPLSPVKTAPIISGSLVYIGCGSTLHVLSVKTGQPRYSIPLQSDIIAPPAVAGNDIYVMCKNRKLYAYTAGLSAPKLKWVEPVSVGLTAVGSPTVAGNTVFLGTNKGSVIAYAAADGHLLWRYNMAPSVVGNSNQSTDFTDVSAPVVIADGALFVMADDGAMRCFRNDAADNTPPKIFNISPEQGAVMSGMPPLFVSAILFDESTGINPASIVVKIDDDEVEHTFDAATLTLRYEMPVTRPLKRLSDGRRTITVIASDWKGNELNYSWSFIADNSLTPKYMPKAVKQKMHDATPAKDSVQPNQTDTPASPGGTVNPNQPPRSPFPAPPGGRSGRGKRGGFGPGGNEGSDGTIVPGGPPAPPGPASDAVPVAPASRAAE